LRQILFDAQLLGGPHEGAQVHVVPSGRHTLVVPEAHEACSAELHAHATAITMHPARARANLIAGTTGAMIASVARMRVALARPMAAGLSAAVVSLAARTARADPPALTAPPNEYAGAKSTATFLLIAGGGAFGTGYLAAAAGAGVGLAMKGSEDSKYGGSCGGSSGYAFIPVVGPLLTLQNYPNHQVATYQAGPHVLDCNGSRTALTVMVISDTVVQIGGLAMALTGLVMHAVIAGKEGSAGSVSLSVGSEGAPMGLTLRAVTF
jgi:hypothetical protein